MKTATPTKGKPNPIDRHVGTRMRLGRMMLGLSQEGLGETLGLSIQQVRKYENGKNRISAGRMKQHGITSGLNFPENQRLEFAVAAAAGAVD